MDRQLFYYLAAVPVLGILAQWLAWRLRLPSILLLLLFGILLGQLALTAHGGEAVYEKIETFLFPIVSLSVAIVLFEGGLTLRIAELREAGRVVLRLVTVGALVTWGLTIIAAVWILDMDVRIASLLGAVLVVTGPTVIAPLLRQIRPVRRVGSIVKWEGIVIDPIGAVLAVLVFEVAFASGNDAAESALGGLFLTVLIGLSLGLVAAIILVLLIRRFWIPDYLHSPVFLAAAVGTFALSNYWQPESGLVTVTVLGIALANQRMVPVKHVMEFKENLQVLLISCLFIVLGSRINLGQIQALGWEGPLFLALMILVIRPVSVALASWGTELRWQERAFLAALAPRGIVAAAVSSIFALELLHSPLVGAELAEGAGQLVPVTFLVIIGTVAVYGVSSGPVARLLKLAEPNPQGILFAGAAHWIRDLAKMLKEEGFPVLLVDTNFRNVAAARMAGLRAECSSVLAEHVREELDLAGIGRLLALTPNDEVNALACREFAYTFGRENVYQLPPMDVGSGKRESVAEHLRGRMLFGERWSHDRLQRAVMGGAQVKKTRLTREFSYEDFWQLYGTSAVVLFLLDEKKLIVNTATNPPKPKSGQVVIALVEASQEDPKAQIRRDAAQASLEQAEKES